MQVAVWTSEPDLSWWAWLDQFTVEVFLAASTTHALRGEGFEHGVVWILYFIAVAWPTQFGQQLPQDLSSGFVHRPG